MADAWIEDGDEFDALSLGPIPVRCTLWKGRAPCGGEIREVPRYGLILSECAKCGTSWGSRPGAAKGGA